MQVLFKASAMYISLFVSHDGMFVQIFNSRLVLASPETATDADYAAIEGVIGHEVYCRVVLLMLLNTSFWITGRFFMIVYECCNKQPWGKLP